MQSESNKISDLNLAERARSKTASIPTIKTQNIEEEKSEIEFVASGSVRSAGPRVLVVDDQEFNC